jgi:hypothetical protein
MPRDVSIFFVHGMNAQMLDYANSMRDRILDRLPQTHRTHAKFHTIFWADIVRRRSERYLDQARTDSTISMGTYRRLVVEGLGDAAAYQKTRNSGDSAYYTIQGRISEVIRDAASHDDPSRPIVFIAHSLGGHVISSYAWDVNRLKQLTDEELETWDDPLTAAIARELRGASPFRRLDTFSAFVSIGCNIPLFTFTFGAERVVPITKYTSAKRTPAFPGVALDEATRAEARWINFFSRSDLLGYPLKPLSKSYAEEKRIIDSPVKSEGALRAFFLPRVFNAYAAHVGYWKNKIVIRETANLIKRIMDAASRA